MEDVRQEQIPKLPSVLRDDSIIIYSIGGNDLGALLHGELLPDLAQWWNHAAWYQKPSDVFSIKKYLTRKLTPLVEEYQETLVKLTEIVQSDRIIVSTL